MYSIIDFSLLLLFALAIIVVYFVYEKVLALKAFSFLKYNDYVIDGAAGLIFGSAALIPHLIIKAISPEFSIPIFLLISVVLIMVKNTITSLVAMFIPLIYQIINANDLFVSLVNISTLGVILSFYSLTKFFNEKYSIIIIFIFLFIASIVDLLVLHNIGGIPMDRYLYENSIFIPIAILIIYYPLRAAKRFSISASILFESVNYVYGRYFRHPLFQTTFSEYLKSNSIKKGYLLLFKISTDGSDEYNDIIEVRETILSKVENYFNEQTILFQQTESAYGVFIPTEHVGSIGEIIKANNGKRIDGFMREVEALMESASSSYLTSSGEVVSVSLKAGVSVYGVQSSSLDTLEKNATFAINNIIAGTVNMYDDKMFMERTRDRLKVRELDEAIDLNTFEIDPIKLSNGKSVWVYINIIKKDDNPHAESVDKLKKITNWEKTFDRYFAASALEKFKNENIIIKYSPLEDTSFKYSILINNLKKAGHLKSKIIFVVEKLEKLNKTILFEKNLRFAKLLYDPSSKLPKIKEHSSEGKALTFNLYEEPETNNKKDDKTFFRTF